MKKINKDKFPLVTVITPAYNRANFLEETIQSVLNQDYPNIEYIVLDDGSTDGTPEVLKKFEGKINIVSHKNMGEVKTVNKGFSMADGEIIGVVNSDDPLLPGAVSGIVAFMKRNPQIVVVYPDWVKIDERGKVIKRITAPDYNYEYMLLAHDCLPGPGTFFRRIIVDKLNGRDTRFRYVSDYDFWLRAGLIGQFGRVPETLATWRSHEGSATYKDKGYKMAMEHISVINKIFSLPDLPPHVKKVRPKAYIKACEAARICRGDNIGAKVLITLVSLYYSPISYLKLFLTFRLTKYRKLLRI